MIIVTKINKRRSVIVGWRIIIIFVIQFNNTNNKETMTKTTLRKLVKKINKDNAPPEGWTEEAKAGAKHAAAIGLSLSDLDDSGDMAEELADIMDLNSDLYK